MKQLDMRRLSDQTRNVLKTMAKEIPEQSIDIMYSSGLDSATLALCAFALGKSVYLHSIKSSQLLQSDAQIDAMHHFVHRLEQSADSSETWGYRPKLPATYVLELGGFNASSFQYGQMAIWSSMIPIMVSGTRPVAIGYVCGDAAISFLSEIKRATESRNILPKVKTNNSLKVVFPFRKFEKETLAVAFREIADAMDISKLEQCITSCESASQTVMPIRGLYLPCGKCLSCKRFDLKGVVQSTNIINKQPIHSFVNYYDSEIYKLHREVSIRSDVVIVTWYADVYHRNPIGYITHADKEAAAVYFESKFYHQYLECELSVKEVERRSRHTRKYLFDIRSDLKEIDDIRDPTLHCRQMNHYLKSEVERFKHRVEVKDVVVELENVDGPLTCIEGEVERVK